MTEKRFYTIHKGVYDELKRKELHHGEITSMLNSLHEENEQLNQQISDNFNQSNCITVQKSIISDLKKENKELKENCKNYNWYKQCKTLLNENDELKKDLNEYCNFSLHTILDKKNKEIEKLKSICQDHRDHAIDFKADCVRLEKENDELKLLVQNWEALDEEKDEQLDKQNQALKKLKKENEKLKSEIKDLNDILARYEEKELEDD